MTRDNTESRDSYVDSTNSKRRRIGHVVMFGDLLSVIRELGSDACKDMEHGWNATLEESVKAVIADYLMFEGWLLSDILVKGSRAIVRAYKGLSPKDRKTINTQ